MDIENKGASAPADTPCNDECDNYPYYGVAPHECFWRKPGGFEGNKLGTSTIDPVNTWPKNFYAEIVEEQTVTQQMLGSLTGVYYCPCCMSGAGDSPDLYDNERITAALEVEAFDELLSELKKLREKMKSAEIEGGSSVDMVQQVEADLKRLIDAGHLDLADRSDNEGAPK